MKLNTKSLTLTPFNYLLVKIINPDEDLLSSSQLKIDLKRMTAVVKKHSKKKTHINIKKKKEYYRHKIELLNKIPFNPKKTFKLSEADKKTLRKNKAYIDYVAELLHSKVSYDDLINLDSDYSKMKYTEMISDSKYYKESIDIIMKKHDMAKTLEAEFNKLKIDDNLIKSLKSKINKGKKKTQKKGKKENIPDITLRQLNGMKTEALKHIKENKSSIIRDMKMSKDGYKKNLKDLPKLRKKVEKIQKLAIDNPRKYIDHIILDH
jgi:hypothetical protein